MMRRTALMTGLITASAALGQSFNVDFSVTSGGGVGAPSFVYPGAAGQPGVWNNITSASPLTTTLTNLDNSPSTVALSRGNGSFVTNSNVTVNGSLETLIEDTHRSNSDGQALTYAFSNLNAGTYAVFTYAVHATSQVQINRVSVTGSTSPQNQSVGGMFSQNSTYPLLSHAIQVVNVAAGGSVAITVTPQDPQQLAVCSGIQLKKLTGSKIRFCVDDSDAGTWEHGGYWGEAFANLQEALASVRLAGGANSEVWVANGFYEPATADRFGSYDIPNHLKMYGGFVGDETDVDQRDGFYLTYLNGNIGDNAASGDNSYTVVVAEGTASDTLLDGFRIHNGNNNGGGTTDEGHGGGLRIQGGSMTVRNCNFVDNRSSNYGGGVYLAGGSATFVDCLFYNNEAFGGSGVFHSGSLLRMYNCRFMNNNGFEGTVGFEGTDGTLANCVFTGNYVGGEGAAIHADGINAQVNVVNCTIAGNAAGQTTGGAFAQNGADIELRNCILWENQDAFNQVVRDKQYDTSGAGSTVTVWACTVQGESGSPGLDPLFVDGNGTDNTWGTFDDNCNLLANSSAINGGNADSVPADLGDLDQDGNTAEQLPIDFNGDRRVRDVVVDRGAYEFQPPCDLDGDLDQDDDVDLTDLATLLANFGLASGQQLSDGDTDGDGDVDLTDLSTLLGNYGDSCP
ncbi:MAG: right-handed parallel beta-helix repeat-containing protein [Phycisphaerae bacterium]